MSGAPPTPSRGERAAEIAEILVGIALQTREGQYAWNGYLIGAGHPKGKGSLRVESACYVPEHEAESESGPTRGG